MERVKADKTKSKLPTVNREFVRIFWNVRNADGGVFLKYLQVVPCWYLVSDWVGGAGLLPYH